VIVDPREMFNRSTALLRRLALMPKAEVRDRQRRLREKAFTLQYGLRRAHKDTEGRQADSWEMLRRAMRLIKKDYQAQAQLLPVRPLSRPVSWGRRARV